MRLVPLIDEGLGNSAYLLDVGDGRALAVTAGHISGAAPAGLTVVMCGHGERAMTAATLLERSGHRDLGVLVGGPADWAAATGKNLWEGQ